MCTSYGKYVYIIYNNKIIDTSHNTRLTIFSQVPEVAKNSLFGTSLNFTGAFLKPNLRNSIPNKECTPPGVSISKTR